MKGNILKEPGTYETAEYICDTCGYEIGFIPEDYDFDKSKYPTTCGMCQEGKKV